MKDSPIVRRPPLLPARAKPAPFNVEQALADAVQFAGSRPKIFDEVVEAGKTQQFLQLACERENRRAITKPVSGLFRVHLRNAVRIRKESKDPAIRRQGILLELQFVATVPHEWALFARRFVEDHFDVLDRASVEKLLEDRRFPAQVEEFAKRLLDQCMRRLNQASSMDPRLWELVILVWISAHFLGLHDRTDQFRAAISERFGLPEKIMLTMNQIRRRFLNADYS